MPKTEISKHTDAQEFKEAVKYGDLSKMNQILSRRNIHCDTIFDDDERKRPIEIAIENGHLDTIKMLLANDVEIRSPYTDGTVLMDKVIATNNKAVINYFQNESTIHLELHKAAAEGKLDKINQLIGKGYYSINYRNSEGKRPVDVAAYYGHTAIVKFLIDNCHAEYQTNNNRPSALYWALRGGNNNDNEIVTYLKTKGLVENPVPLSLTDLPEPCKARIIKYLQYNNGQPAVSNNKDLQAVRLTSKTMQAKIESTPVEYRRGGDGQIARDSLRHFIDFSSKKAALQEHERLEYTVRNYDEQGWERGTGRKLSIPCLPQSFQNFYCAQSTCCTSVTGFLVGNLVGGCFGCYFTGFPSVCSATLAVSLPLPCCCAACVGSTILGGLLGATLCTSSVKTYRWIAYPLPSTINERTSFFSSDQDNYPQGKKFGAIVYDEKPAQSEDDKSSLCTMRL